MKVGFIGLGIMGAPMCGHLIAGGHQLFVNTRSKVPDVIAAAATVCASAAEVARQAPDRIAIVACVRPIDWLGFSECSI